MRMCGWPLFRVREDVCVLRARCVRAVVREGCVDDVRAVTTTARVARHSYTHHTPVVARQHATTSPSRQPMISPPSAPRHPDLIPHEPPTRRRRHQRITVMSSCHHLVPPREQQVDARDVARRVVGARARNAVAARALLLSFMAASFSEPHAWSSSRRSEM